MKRIKRCEQPGANGSSTRGRELLSAYDCTESGKSRLALAQSKSPRFVGDGFEARIREHQLGESELQIGFGAKEVGNAFPGIVWLASMEVAEVETRTTT